jgi:nitrogen fixation-related uncharacterized protein
VDIDMLIYIGGSILITAITVGFVVWGIKTEQFKENDHLKYKAIEEEEGSNYA